MKYQLSISYLTDDDLRPYRPTIPEHEEADIFIQAFVEDISLFSCTTSAYLEQLTVIIELKSDFNLKNLNDELKVMNPIYREMFKTTGFFKV
ncbi:hypothetical protein [Aliivibrio logei]|uniref:Uncharacterized protein n=1 Tax=Aliivibrio logei TaxID=688 RepID=A0A1B9NW14_ALILO|nr:hypothetical protein [Aliivibrio logei]OCH19258.1 hypothetical protein A6E04_16830 [Aliivibrio logei]